MPVPNMASRWYTPSSVGHKDQRSVDLVLFVCPVGCDTNLKGFNYVRCSMRMSFVLQNNKTLSLSYRSVADVKMQIVCLDER